MTATALQPPRKTRELHNHPMDSTVWNEFQFREDDIIIGTYAKSGTTWTQQIIPILDFRPRRGDMNGLGIGDYFSLVLQGLQASHP